MATAKKYKSIASSAPEGYFFQDIESGNFIVMTAPHDAESVRKQTGAYVEGTKADYDEWLASRKEK